MVSMEGGMMKWLCEARWEQSSRSGYWLKRKLEGTSVMFLYFTFRTRTSLERLGWILIPLDQFGRVHCQVPCSFECRTPIQFTGLQARTPTDEQSHVPREKKKCVNTTDTCSRDYIQIGIQKDHGTATRPPVCAPLGFLDKLSCPHTGCLIL